MQPEVHVPGPVSHEPGGHAHPSARTYIIVAVVLTIITGFEVAVYYIPAIRQTLPALASPLQALRERYLFSAAVGRHVLLIMVMPPLLLASVTPAMVRRLLAGDRRVLALAGCLTRPAIGYLACNVIFTVSHLPTL